MKEYFLIIMFAVLIFSCENNEDTIFDATLDSSNFTFEPIAGGAIMKYDMPKNADIFYIQAKYKTQSNKAKLVVGSYLSNSMVLDGFAYGQSDVPVEICLLNKAGEESKKIYSTFTVLDCAANSIFDNLKVSSYWSGFQVEYEAPDIVNGFIHIGHIGENLMTNEIDTLLINSYPIKSGKNTLLFSDIYDKDKMATDVVVWTEDSKGNEMSKRIFKDVPAAITVKLDPLNFGFEGASVEDEFNGVSWKNLFDGDSKGINKIEKNDWKDYMFISTEQAVPGFWTIDIKEPKTIGKINIYAPLNINLAYWYQYFAYSMIHYMPSHVKIYCSNDPNLPIEEWEEMGEFFEHQQKQFEKRWAYPSIDSDHKYKDAKSLKAAEPCFMSINLKMSENKYRYVRVEILDVFRLDYYGSKQNKENVVAFSELEIFVKQE